MFDVDVFRREGYVVLRDVVDHGLLDPFIEVLSQKVGELAGGRFADLPFDRRIGALYQGRTLNTREWQSALFCREFWAIVTAPQITGPLRLLLGDEITYQGNAHLRPYLSNHLDRLPWHQDGQFYGAGIESMVWSIAQVWLPLTDAGADAGCMALVPRSHHWGLISQEAGPDTDPEEIYRLTASRVKFEPIQLVPMRKGDLLLFTNLLAHTGTENRSGLVRWSVDMRFETTYGSRPLTPALKDGYRVTRRRMASRNARPLRVCGAAGPQSWEEWDANGPD
ncbi:phytanoyl-CoA dioxygenase family protein [Allorhizocola rhizosphaerae]|uniref:phytanoyl-CoA dioxygenase family protein n=1 Tax=Allorhizocola rhizosphaerae TaxID=1872709 RepID=UPI000E3CDD75|nr:phytanoyl-CoA dioxygenase family protein [Allorhizocola rhizosphaerae]